jgi:hypothetical protein
MDYMKIGTGIDSFYKLCDIFEENYYILTLAIKHFEEKSIRPSIILECLENYSFNPIEKSLNNLYKMDQKELKSFLNIFAKVKHIEDYDVYKAIYDLNKDLLKKDVLIKNIRIEHSKTIKVLKDNIKYLEGKYSLFA